LIGLLGREDERDRNLFFERGDIEERIFLKDSFSYQKTEEAPGDGEDMVHRGSLHGEIGPHVEEEGGLKGTQIGSTLMQITIKEAKMVSAGAEGISQAFPISEIVVEMRGEETLKGFHGKGPFS
jgi:hypothetical protein